MRTEQSSKGLTLVCDDLGEVDQIIQDDLGLLPIDDGKSGRASFLRYADRASLAKARAFLTELRIAHKVIDHEFSIQTTRGAINIYFAGVKSKDQFVIVGAETPEFRNRLYAEVIYIVNEGKPDKQKTVLEQISPKKALPEIEKTISSVLEEHPKEPRNESAEKNEKNEELEKLRQDFYEAATRDSLTGLYNRRHFLKRMREELHEAERYKRSTVFLVVDIDNFGVINEKYGFEMGDEVVRALGHLIRGLLRNVDLVGRLGGDEFGALLLETNLASSVVIAKRLQKKLAGIVIDFEGLSLQATVSIAMIPVETAKFNPDKLLKLAEKHIQKARESGGNQIVQD